MSNEQSGTGIQSSDHPYRDKETLESMYEEGMTYEEMADQLNTAPSTISNWLKRHEITVDFPEIDLEQYSEPYFQDAELLDRLYNEEMMSTTEISAFLGCSSASISSWMSEHSIKTRTSGEAQSVAKGNHNKVAYYSYERGHTMLKSGNDRIAVHQLVAISEFGADAVAGMHVHHKNGVPWDNRPQNLELLTNSDHQKTHRKMGWLESIRAAEMYREGASSYDIAPTFDVAAGTVINAVRRVDEDLIRGHGA